jgi:hypothetical protein
MYILLNRIKIMDKCNVLPIKVIRHLTLPFITFSEFAFQDF